VKGAILRLLANRFTYLIGEAMEKGRWQYIYEQYRRKYEISPTFHFNGPQIILYGNGRIILQESSYIGTYSLIESWDNCEVRIGRNCAISYFVMILNGNRSPDQDFSKCPNWGPLKITAEGNVKIGDNCWIGAVVYVNQGVSIGENAVIGAHSVVTRDIPPHSIAVGAPAKVIKFKSYLDEKEMIRLAKQYWHSLNPELKKRIIKKYDEFRVLEKATAETDRF